MLLKCAIPQEGHACSARVLFDQNGQKLIKSCIAQFHVFEIIAARLIDGYTQNNCSNKLVKHSTTKLTIPTKSPNKT